MAVGLLPDVFPLLKASAAVTAIVGAAPARIHHVAAPQSPVPPYLVWALNGLGPEDNLSGLPPVDLHGVQVDAYAKDDTTVDRLAKAVRDALEPHMRFVGVNVDTKETETGLYRIGLQFDYWVSR